MKKVLSGAAVLAAITVMAAIPAYAAGPICLSTRNINSTTPQDDGKAIVFNMKDGSAWRNELHGRCPDLKFNGFVWAVQNPGATVCENENALTVIRSGEVCVLGKFTQVKQSRSKQKEM
jgi:hypothetical protein